MTGDCARVRHVAATKQKKDIGNQSENYSDR